MFIDVNNKLYPKLTKTDFLYDFNHTYMSVESLSLRYINNYDNIYLMKYSGKGLVTLYKYSSNGINSNKISSYLLDTSTSKILDFDIYYESQTSKKYIFVLLTCNKIDDVTCDVNLVITNNQMYTKISYNLGSFDYIYLSNTYVRIVYPFIIYSLSSNKIYSFLLDTPFKDTYSGSGVTELNFPKNRSIMFNDFFIETNNYISDIDYTDINLINSKSYYFYNSHNVVDTLFAFFSYNENNDNSFILTKLQGLNDNNQNYCMFFKLYNPDNNTLKCIFNCKEYDKTNYDCLDYKNVKCSVEKANVYGECKFCDLPLKANNNECISNLDSCTNYDKVEIYDEYNKFKFCDFKCFKNQFNNNGICVNRCPINKVEDLDKCIYCDINNNIKSIASNNICTDKCPINTVEITAYDNQLKVYYKYCDKNCPNNQFDEDGICVDSCTKAYFYSNVTNNICEFCPINKKADNNVCIYEEQNCSDNKLDITIYSNIEKTNYYKYCDYNCPDNLIVDNNICVDKCPVDKVNIDKKCEYCPLNKKADNYNNSFETDLCILLYTPCSNNNLTIITDSNIAYCDTTCLDISYVIEDNFCKKECSSFKVPIKTSSYKNLVCEFCLENKLFYQSTCLEICPEQKLIYKHIIDLNTIHYCDLPCNDVNKLNYDNKLIYYEDFSCKANCEIPENYYFIENNYAGFYYNCSKCNNFTYLVYFKINNNYECIKDCNIYNLVNNNINNQCNQCTNNKYYYKNETTDQGLCILEQDCKYPNHPVKTYSTELEIDINVCYNCKLKKLHYENNKCVENCSEGSFLNLTNNTCEKCKWYNELNYCVDNCSLNFEVNGNQCVCNELKGFYLVKSEVSTDYKCIKIKDYCKSINKILQGNNCVEYCGKDYYYFESLNECLLSCKDNNNLNGYKFYFVEKDINHSICKKCDFYFEDNNCVKNCSNYKDTNDNSNICLSCSELNNKNYVLDKKCVTKCPDIYYSDDYNGIKNTCLLKNETNKIKNDIKCSSNGEITAIDNKTFCKCKKNYYGIACEDYIEITDTTTTFQQDLYNLFENYETFKNNNNDNLFKDLSIEITDISKKLLVPDNKVTKDELKSIVNILEVLSDNLEYKDSLELYDNILEVLNNK